MNITTLTHGSFHIMIYRNTLIHLNVEKSMFLLPLFISICLFLLQFSEVAVSFWLFSIFFLLWHRKLRYDCVTFMNLLKMYKFLYYCLQIFNGLLISHKNINFVARGTFVIATIGNISFQNNIHFVARIYCLV